MSFHLIFATVLALTVVSGAVATVLAMVGDAQNNRAQRRIIEVLSQIALLGAGAMIALLARSAQG